MPSMREGLAARFGADIALPICSASGGKTSVTHAAQRYTDLGGSAAGR
jgi:hypothetical protein